jgi:hypothetical protein
MVTSKKNKLKQIINTNLKSTKSLKDKIDFKKSQKDSIER